jgi:hypothetical protein
MELNTHKITLFYHHYHCVALDMQEMNDL